jgi:hypothetical protein
MMGTGASFVSSANQENLAKDMFLKKNMRNK